MYTEMNTRIEQETKLRPAATLRFFVVAGDLK